MSRLPLRIAALIVFFFSFLLFYSGWVLQQRSLNAMQQALNPHHAKKASPKSPKSGFHLMDQTDSKKSRLFSNDKRKLAYVQYVSEKSDLCNSVMILAELDRLGAVADKVLIYPRSWVADEKGRWSRLLKVAEQRYGVIVKAVSPLIEVGDAPAVSLLHAFAQTEYNRILYLDPSGMVLRNLDELLFGAPSAPVAGIRAYWRSQTKQAENPLSDHLLLIEPSEQELKRVKAILKKDATKSPTELINRLYISHTLILPQHPYDTVISEFRADEHDRYVMGEVSNWNPSKIREESYYVNFEDDETPKPWYAMPGNLLDKVRPRRSDDEKVWKSLYDLWARQRMDVCGLDLEPLPAGF